MKIKSFTKKSISLMLVAVLLVTASGISAFAAKGDLSNVSTGLTGNIDTSDTVSFPIEIYDYDADGMLFEYAESKQTKTISDFNPTETKASFTSATSIDTHMYGDFWNCTTETLNTTNSEAHFLRVTWAKNSTQNPHAGFGRDAAGVILPNDLGEEISTDVYSGLAMDDARYLTLVYRSNVTSGKIGFFVERENANRYNENNRVADLTFTSEGTTNWTYAVYDLKQGNLKNTWSNYGKAKAIWTTLPIDDKGEYMDIAYAYLFSDAKMAENFGRFAITLTTDHGDNRGFGLLRSSRNEDGSNAYPGVVDSTDTVTQLNSFTDSSEIEYSTITNLGYELLGTFGVSGIANIGLIESGLSEEGYPVYKQEVVEYLAGLLKHSLEIPERTSDGWKNYRFVQGTPSSRFGGTDLATALRNRINGNLGSYAESDAKDLIGTWEEVNGNISSYHDAAYFLLNSIFVPNSYNIPQDDYDHLILSAGIDSETGEKAYVFDAGFTTSSTPSSAESAVKYDTENKTISNTTAAGKTHFVYEGNSTTTLNPFLPITDKNNSTDQTDSVYYQDDGVINNSATKDTYVNRNFNFALVSHGEFVYHADHELFFDFEGDDDVYLFINGELVLDIGSAHSIDKVDFKVNDYVNWAKETLNDPDATAEEKARAQKLNLIEGNTYSFNFYYMERHGYGSNMRMSNNFKVSDPSMITEKFGYQDDIRLDYGSVVNKDKVVEYGFAITNSGEENLYNFTFKDADIGVELTYTDGLNITGSRVYDKNGGTLTASDLVAVVSHPDYEDITVTFANNEELKNFLVSLSDEAVIASGDGLWVNSTISIRGIGYRLSEKQISDGVFDNTVVTSATNASVLDRKTLHGQANMRVFVPSDPMYYQWAGHEINISKQKLITDILAAANQEDNLLNGKVSKLTVNNVNKIEFTTSSGNAITYDNVTMDSSYNFTVNYPSAGSNVFYIKITYNNSQNSVILPVLVNITDVTDSVFVLDYGLSVDLTENGELYRNDKVNVPGRVTETKVWGVSSEAPSYSPNNIIFSLAEGNTVDGKYGDFTVTEDKALYTPDKFMEGKDSAYIAIGVYEDGESNNALGDVNINKEVQMYKSVSTVPANVVYYEDSFPAIRYNTATENVITSVKPDKAPLQSASQSENYGHDSAYENTDEDEQSAGALTTIELKGYGEAASFTFTGTGFEIIGRTNAKNSGTIMVQVKDENGTLIKSIPVITEYDNYDNEGDEEIYQVPVIRVTDLSTVAQTYTVSILGFPARDYDNPDENGVPPIKPSYLYIDGIRIYQPVEGITENSTVLEDYYIDTEKDAVFTEVRDEIVKGNIGTVSYNSTDGISFSTATSTWTEYYSETIFDYQLKFNAVTSVNEYLMQGPNNEVYQTGTYDNSALVFYVKETDSAYHSAQIGLRGLDESLFFAGIESGTTPDVNAAVRVGIYEDGTYKWDKYLAQLSSSTEQYYTIDYKNCYFDESKGAYQIVIRVDEGLVSFTNIKLTGLELISIEGEATDLYYENGILMQPSEDEQEPEAAEPVMFASFFSLRRQMSTSEVVPEYEEEITEEETTEEETTEEETTSEETTTEEATDSSDGDDSGSDGSSAFGRFLAFIKKFIMFVTDIFNKLFNF